jgi:hypothetical protein
MLEMHTTKIYFCRGRLSRWAVPAPSGGKSVQTMVLSLHWFARFAQCKPKRDFVINCANLFMSNTNPMQTVFNMFSPHVQTIFSFYAEIVQTISVLITPVSKPHTNHSSVFLLSSHQ